MRHISGTLAALLVAFSLTACKISLPTVTSASIEQFNSSGIREGRQLTAEQCAELTEWFEKHRSGWSASYATYAPSIEVRVVHEGGASSVVNIVGMKIVVYGSFGQYERKSSRAEITSLQRALGANGG